MKAIFSVICFILLAQISVLKAQKRAILLDEYSNVVLKGKDTLVFRWASEGRIPFMVLREGMYDSPANRVGFLDTSGTVAVGATFSACSNFVNGYAVVAGTDKPFKYGLINRAGKLLFPTKYDGISRCLNGLFCLRKDGFIAFVDIKGKMIVPFGRYTRFATPPPVNTEADDTPYQGFRWYLLPNLSTVYFAKYLGVKAGDKWALINDKGKEIVPARYDVIGIFKGNLAPVTIAKKMGVINTKGALVVPAVYNQLYITDGEFIIVEAGKMQGVVSVNNQMLIPIEHQRISYLRGNAFLVSNSGKCGVINTKNQVIIPIENGGIEAFGEGYKVFGYGFGLALYSGDGKRISKFTRNARTDYPFWRDGDSTFVFNQKSKRFVGYEDIREYYEYDNRYESDRKHKPSLFYSRNKKWGVMDSTGVEITPPLFDSIDYQRVDGLPNKRVPIAAKINRKWGLIDTRGKTIFPFKYDNIGRVYPGMLIQQGKKVGFTNSNLAIILAVKYDSIATTFDNNTPSRQKNYLFARLNKKWAYFSFNGKQLTPFKYDAYPVFQRDIGIGKINNKYGIINTKGKQLTDYIYDNIAYSSGYNSGYNYDKRLVVTKGKMVGLLDTAGYVLAPLVYETLSQMHYPFFEKYEAKYKGKMGMLDGNGKVIIPFDFDEIQYYNSDLSWPCIVAKKDWYYGLMNLSGTPLTEFIYSRLVKRDFEYEMVLNGKMGLMDSTGKVTLAPRHERLSYRMDNTYVYTDNHKSGLMTLTGELLTPPIYDEINYQTPECIIVKKSFKYGMIDANGKEKYPCIYYKITCIDGKAPELIKWGQIETK